MKRYVVLDIETIPSEVKHTPKPSELSRMLEEFSWHVESFGMDTMAGLSQMKRVSKALVEALKKADERFPPPPCHQVVCVAGVSIEWGETLNISMGLFPGQTEKEILLSMRNMLENPNNVLATWNGRHLDLPVLTVRALRHGIDLPSFSDRWQYRYSDKHHIDVMDWLAGYGAATMFKLDQGAKLIGMPGKPPGVSGGSVAEMIAEGRLKEVQDYCLSDVVHTAGLLFRTMHFRGNLSFAGCQEACKLLLEKAEADERVRWVAEQTDRKVFLMEEMQAIEEAKEAKGAKE